MSYPLVLGGVICNARCGVRLADICWLQTPCGSEGAVHAGIAGRRVRILEESQEGSHRSDGSSC